METVAQGISVQNALWSAADGDIKDFAVAFSRLRKLLPDETTEACLGYIARNGLNPAGYSMAFWLGLYDRYFTILFDPAILPIEVAEKALAALKEADSQVFRKFLKAAEGISSRQPLLRALRLAQKMGDYTALLPWLRRLTHHSDGRVKSRAVKLLCELRPNGQHIDHHMQGHDARVRANVIEALWDAKAPGAAEVFNAATSDPNHRVVANALVGLYRLGDPSALPRIIELSQSPNARLRSAMAWCLGFIGDQGGIPALRSLLNDPSMIVRKRAQRDLLALTAGDSGHQLVTQSSKDLATV
jgi:HEAT repeat protein